MTKLRTNHGRQGSAGMAVRVILFVFILAILLVYLFRFLGEWAKDQNTKTAFDAGIRTYLPTSSGELVHHRNYSLSYVEEHEQAEWVAYVLSREKLRIPNVERTDWYSADPAVSTLSAVHGDYSRSGYTRGHLAPAGDMAHSEEAMEESFYMSNISPQKRAFNNGIWKELEELVRDWAFTEGELVVVTGPVLSNIGPETLGKNRVSVPNQFFKVILDQDLAEEKAIAFVIPNRRCEEPLQEFAVTVDSVEVLTGINFFEDLLNDPVEEKIENDFQLSQWEFDENKYGQRIKKWNYQ